MLSKEFLETFLLSTIVNTFADTETNRSLLEKVARAALVSIPTAMTIDTTKAITKVADRFPNLGITDTTYRPQTVQELASQVENRVRQNRLRIIAHYTRPEDQWKNPTS